VLKEIKPEDFEGSLITLNEEKFKISSLLSKLSLGE